MGETERATRWLDEEKEADDDDGYKGGLSGFVFVSRRAVNPSGDRAAAVYGLPELAGASPSEGPRGRESNAVTILGIARLHNVLCVSSTDLTNNRRGSEEGCSRSQANWVCSKWDAHKSDIRNKRLDLWNL